MFVYLFAKKDRANIEDDELADFRTLAHSYAAVDDAGIADLLAGGDLMELGDGERPQI